MSQRKHLHPEAADPRFQKRRAEALRDRTPQSHARRTFLRGLGGIGISLPFLEYFAPRKAHAAVINRYIVSFAGTSIGFSGGDSVVPQSVGPLAGNLSIGLQPLADLGATDYVSAVSGLYIPWGSPVPAAGRFIRWHSSSPNVLLSGMRSPDDDGDESLQGPSSDYVVADTLHAGSTKEVLAYRVQAAFYRGDNGTGGTRGTMSARLNGSGDVEEVPPISSPRGAYQRLFEGFSPPDPTEAKAAAFLLARRKSVIDLVRGDTEKLIPRLGRADQIRMQRHFDEVRSLENRLNQIQPPTTENCQLLPNPGDDPPIGDAVENGNQGEGGGYDGNAAYSGEEERATLMADMIRMAFVCDLSRVSAFMFTYSQCFLNMNPITNAPSDLHEIGHYAMGGGQTGQDELAKGVAWHVKHWARLLDGLKDVEDTDGSMILDNTAAILTFEGGWGADPEQGSSGEAHSSENMFSLIGGRAGGLHQNPGQHIDGNGRHPVEVINTAMHSIGVAESLGEVPGNFDAELLT